MLRRLAVLSVALGLAATLAAAAPAPACHRSCLKVMATAHTVAPPPLAATVRATFSGRPPAQESKAVLRQIDRVGFRQFTFNLSTGGIAMIRMARPAAPGPGRLT